MTDIPPLMKLAPELHLMIAKKLDFLDLLLFRNSTSYFRQLIKPYNYEQLIDGFQLVFLQHNACERLEQENRPRISPNDWSPCTDCCLIRPIQDFMHGLDLNTIHETTCIECMAKKDGIGHRIGDKITLDRRDKRLCRECNGFKEDIGRRAEGLCESCWSRFERMEDELWKKFDKIYSRARSHYRHIRTSRIRHHHNYWRERKLAKETGNFGALRAVVFLGLSR